MKNLWVFVGIYVKRKEKKRKLVVFDVVATEFDSILPAFDFNLPEFDSARVE